jgi:hypothetical protein
MDKGIHSSRLMAAKCHRYLFRVKWFWHFATVDMFKSIASGKWPTMFRSFRVLPAVCHHQSSVVECFWQFAIINCLR